MYKISEEKLSAFCTKVFCTLGMSIDDANICSNILVEADLRGISSHGTDALQRYIAGIEEKIIDVSAKPKVISENPVLLSLDACGGMGMISSYLAMQTIIDKARISGIGIATVKNSNHFGFGAYYALQAAKNDMIGLAMSNTAAIVVPTYGTQAKLGTNPISFAAPGKLHPSFVLDIATSTVPRGVVKRYADEKRPIPEGWAIDERGEYLSDPAEVLRLLSKSIGGGLVPLGGKDTVHGGHKGYGIALMVDILTGLLSGHSASYAIQDTERSAGRSAHSFIVIAIEHFRTLDEFKADMDAMLEALIQSPSISGHTVQFHGKHEELLTKRQKKEGIELSASIYAALQNIAQKYNIDSSI